MIIFERYNVNYYSLAENYRKMACNAEDESIPTEAAFKSREGGEKHIFESRDSNVSYYQVIKALEEGIITDLDKCIICLIGKFAAGFLTSKLLRELLKMLGVEFTDHVLESSLKRLHRYQLINFSRFLSADSNNMCNFKVISITEYGSKLAKSLSVNHRYNGIALATAKPHEVKSRLAAAQLAVQYLKYTDFIVEFQIRPVLSVNPELGAIIRPGASFVLETGEYVNVEAPRRSNEEEYLEDLKEKLHRYELCFKNKEVPTIIICCEDDEMAYEIDKTIRPLELNLQIYFTSDLSLFGTNFMQSLWQYDDSGCKRLFKFKFN